MSNILLRQFRRIPLLDRWLIGEIMGPLLFAIAAFTVFGLAGGVLFELVRRIVESGLSPWVALQMVALKLPSFLVIALPMATLLATLLAYSRLSANSELTALRSVGVSTTRLIIPAMALALTLTVLTFVLNDWIVPQSNRTAEVTLQRALGRSLATEKGKDIIYSRFGRMMTREGTDLGRGLQQLFYSRRFDKGEMVDVTVLDFSRSGFRQMLVADRAIWNEPEAKWEFLDGQILTLNTNGSTTRVDFDRYLYPLSSGPLKVAKLPSDANNMTIGQVYEAQRLYIEAGNTKEARRMAVRIQEKFTFPMSCLIFALIGSSLGARPGAKKGWGWGFGISILLIFATYLLSFSFSSLGVKGILPPIAAAWLPVLISLSAGGLLLKQASR